LTRSLDAIFAVARHYAPPLHWLGAAALAVCLYLYAHICALTIRLTAVGGVAWPADPQPGVWAIWHGGVNALIVAITARRPRTPLAVMIAGNPRGDSLALLCRLLGLRVARVAEDEGGWSALAELSGEIERGACVIITADGSGPARVARVGAVALASATGAPVFAFGADCHPAISMPHKWDEARTPLPFGRVAVAVSEPRHCPEFTDSGSIEDARLWLQQALDEAAALAARALAHPP
jgi:lysophospholipid acyltransferase (LPLAT)-like uncharacterized protein